MKFRKSFNVLCLFDYNCTTGFATVSQNIIKQLRFHFKGRMKLDIVAINYFGQPFKEDDNTIVISASTPSLDGEVDAYGRKIFLRMLLEDNYDGVFIIQDMAVACPMFKIMHDIIMPKKKGMLKKKFKTLYYFPVDGRPVVHDWFEGFKYVDSLVTYTEYGRREMIRAMPELQGKIKVIPHGVNHRHFNIMHPDRIDQFRKDYFGKNEGKFIVTNVNRNQPRKDIPTTIFAFEEFKNKYFKNSFLYLHMTPRDAMGWDLPKILQQTSLVEGEDYMFPPPESFDAGAKIETLNAIYNSSDVLLNTTTGEGWGLAITEAMACALPVIAPMHTAVEEIGDYGARVWPIKEFYPYVTHFDNDVRHQSSYEDVADILNVVRQDIEAGRARSDDKVGKALQYVQTLDWQIVCRHWTEEFEKTFS